MFKYNKEKDAILKRERGIGFEEIIDSINHGVLDVYNHPNMEKFPNQKIYVVEALNYVYLVPFVKEDSYIFLKTIIPSRKAKKKYKG